MDPAPEAGISFMSVAIISIASLALAAFFAVVAWRVTRREQQRSAARVAALSAAVDVTTIGPSAFGESDAVSVQPDFLALDRPVTDRQGFLKVAGGGALAVALIVTIATLGSNPPRPSATSAAATRDASLELLSMRHEAAGDALTVTGLVRNAGGSPAERVIAVVFAFDRAGNFIASGRAPLDLISMAPGDESPFRVSVPHVADVGRYRVSFRTESGIVKHIDRRAPVVARGE
jgi:hypothetical protein